MRSCRSRRSHRGSTLTLTVKWNVLPAPGVLSTQMRPPISCTRFDEIVKPRPVPPYRRVIDPSA